MNTDKITQRLDAARTAASVLQYPTYFCLLEFIAFCLCSHFGYKPLWLLNATVGVVIAISILLVSMTVLTVYAVRLQRLEDKAFYFVE